MKALAIFLLACCFACFGISFYLNMIGGEVEIDCYDRFSNKIIGEKCIGGEYDRINVLLLLLSVSFMIGGAMAYLSEGAG